MGCGMNKEPELRDRGPCPDCEKPRRYFVKFEIPSIGDCDAFGAIYVPRQMTEDEHAELLKYVEVFKRGLVAEKKPTDAAIGEDG